MWRTEDLAKFWSQTRVDQRLLSEAALWLFLSRSAILTIPFRWTTRFMNLEPGETYIGATAITDETVERIGWALRVVSSRSPWQSTCLAQALAGVGMLRRRRLPATLALGVARQSSEASGLSAHAWVACGRIILTGGAGIADYVVVAKYSLPAGDSDMPIPNGGRSARNV